MRFEFVVTNGRPERLVFLGRTQREAVAKLTEYLAAHKKTGAGWRLASVEWVRP